MEKSKNFLKLKRKKDEFNDHINHLYELPQEIKKRFMHMNFEVDLSEPILISKPKNYKIGINEMNIHVNEKINNIENDNISLLNTTTHTHHIHHHLNLSAESNKQNISTNSNNENISNFNPAPINEVEDELALAMEEIDEIVNELEIFNRNNRKNRLINFMEAIADSIDDNLIDIEDLTDHMFFGNKKVYIEKEYLLEQKEKKNTNSASNANTNTNNKFNLYLNNQKMCAETNKMLEDDDNEYISKVNTLKKE